VPPALAKPPGLAPTQAPAATTVPPLPGTPPGWANGGAQVPGPLKDNRGSLAGTTSVGRPPRGWPPITERTFLRAQLNASGAVVVIFQLQFELRYLRMA
jgi:hypothetical protein